MREMNMVWGESRGGKSLKERKKELEKRQCREFGRY